MSIKQDIINNLTGIYVKNETNLFKIYKKEVKDAHQFYTDIFNHYVPFYAFREVFYSLKKMRECKRCKRLNGDRHGLYIKKK